MTLEENNTVCSGTYRYTSVAKLDNILVGRYLSLEDNIFVENVVADLQHFLNKEEIFHKSVLIFPPVNNYRRFLIHKICEEITSKELSTFSIGQGFSRRTVVCVKTLIRKPSFVNETHGQSIKRFEDPSSSTMVVERQPRPSGNSPEHNLENEGAKRVRSSPAIYRPPAARKLEAIQIKQNIDVSPTVQSKPSPSKLEKTRSSTRQRRPDLQVYVPRAKRASMVDQSISEPIEHKDVSSNHNQQVFSGVKNDAPSASSCVRSSGNSCFEKTNHLPSQTSAEMDCETRLASKKVNVSCEVTEEENSISSSVNKNCFIINQQEHVKSVVPLDRTDHSVISDNDGCELSDSSLNKNGCCEAMNESKSDVLYSSVSTILNSNNKEESDICKLKTSDSYEINLNDTENNFNLFSNGDLKKIENGSDEKDMKILPDCDHELLNEVGSTQNSSDISFLKDNDSNGTNTCIIKNKEVECGIDQQSSKTKDISVPEILIISDSEISSNTPIKIDVPKSVNNLSKVSSKKSKSTSKQSSSSANGKSKNNTTNIGDVPVSVTSQAVSLNPDECSWDMLFDDNGDCLDPKIMEELTSAVGCVTIEKPNSDYNRFLTRQEINLPGGDDEYAHVVEIYNFPSEFKTQDLLSVFADFKNGGFEIKWVDDTHALGVFSSSRVAADVLAYDHPLVKTRPLSEATPESRLKAKRSAEFLQPYRARPETCVALARRLVTGALGMKIATSREEREAERRLLKEAREKRRLAARQQQDAWEGTIR